MEHLKCHGFRGPAGNNVDRPRLWGFPPALQSPDLMQCCVRKLGGRDGPSKFVIHTENIQEKDGASTEQCRLPFGQHSLSIYTGM
jgi:hypothetical protein